MDSYKILKKFDEVLLKIEDILGTGVTSNIQLYKLGKILFGDRFIGVYSANEFPRVKEGEMFIINTDPNTKPGLHWLAMYKKNKLYGYDSYARRIQTLSKYFKNKRIINANSFRQESYKGSDCGSLAMAYLVTAFTYGPDNIMKII